MNTCEWPRCGKPALCESGNFRNRLVCSDHFTLTNGGGHELEVLRADCELLAVENAECREGEQVALRERDRLRRQRDALLTVTKTLLLGATTTDYGPGGNYASMYETCDYCRARRCVDTGSTETLQHQDGCVVGRAEAAVRDAEANP